jgi:hypothetical protein
MFILDLSGSGLQRAASRKAKRATRDEARRIAANMAELLSLPAVLEAPVSVETK